MKSRQSLHIVNEFEPLCTTALRNGRVYTSLSESRRQLPISSAPMEEPRCDVNEEISRLDKWGSQQLELWL